MILITNSSHILNLALKLSVSVWHWQPEPAQRCVYVNDSHTCSDNLKSTSTLLIFKPICDGGRQASGIPA